MNIAGVVRPLALFDPPIDPGMLVKATAAGIDIGSIVSGLNQPVLPVRCLILIQKALELCGEVRSLGNALLSALEKADAEHLALVRQRHEIQIQQMAREVRFLQWKHAEETTIRKDDFPYFTQGRVITITGVDIYAPNGQNPPKHHAVGNAVEWEAATAELASKQTFIVTAPPDAEGPTKVLTRTESAEVSLIIRYSLS